MLVKRREKQRDLILKLVQVSRCGRREIRRLEDKAFGDVTAFAQSAEDDHVLEEVTVGSVFKHGKSCRVGEWFFRASPAQSRGQRARVQIGRGRSRAAFLGESRRCRGARARAARPPPLRTR